MHRITGDGNVEQSGKKLYADEDLPDRFATQVTHDAMNAIQEEIANVIEAEGMTLNTDAEDPLTACVQLNAAIDNKVKAPRGYIDGFQMNSSDTDTLNIGAGAALDSTNAKWIRKTSAFVKALSSAGTLQTWVAGSGNGGVKSSDLGFWDSAVGQWASGSDTITGLSSTTGMHVGDFIYVDIDTTAFGFGWAMITEIVGGSSIKVDRNFPNNGTNVALRLRGRWYHVWALGKTSDASAFDVVATIDIAALSVGFGAFDIFRRIGSVFIYNIGGLAEVSGFAQHGDDFRIDGVLTIARTLNGFPFGSAYPTGVVVIRTLSPRQVITRASVLFTYVVAAVSGGKNFTSNIQDARGNYVGKDIIYADATYSREVWKNWDLFTDEYGNVSCLMVGGVGSADALIYVATCLYVDRRGKDA